MKAIYSILLFLFLGCSQEEKQTEPQQTTPPQTEPEQTEPQQIEHEQTESQQTTPPPTDPPQNEPEQTEPQQVDKSYIYGTWQLEAVYGFYGWLNVYPYIVTWHFDEDGGCFFSSNRDEERYVEEGSFSIVQDTLITTYLFEGRSIIDKYYYSLEDNKLFLDAFTSSCDEGCTERYVKLSDE